MFNSCFVDFAIFIAIEALGKQLSREIIRFACVVYICHYIHVISFLQQLPSGWLLLPQ